MRASGLPQFRAIPRAAFPGICAGGAGCVLKRQRRWERVNTHEEPERETEALRASHSRLSAARLRSSDSPDLESVLHEALESLRQGVR